MSQYSIVTAPNPVLHRVADEWDFDVDGSPAELVDAMIKVAVEANGVGLAAPQIGISKRIFVARLRHPSHTPIWKAFINPRVEPFDNDTTLENEGCLSIPNVIIPVERWSTIDVFYTEFVTGYPKAMRQHGYNARVIQHEMDHLNGILITDSRPLGVMDSTLAS